MDLARDRFAVREEVAPTGQPKSSTRGPGGARILVQHAHAVLRASAGDLITTVAVQQDLSTVGLNELKAPS